MVAELKPQQNIIAVSWTIRAAWASPNTAPRAKRRRSKALQDGVLDELQKKFQTRLYRLDSKLTRIAELERSAAHRLRPRTSATA